MAGPAGRRVEGEPRHAAAVDADRRQDPHGTNPADVALVERAAVRHRPRAHDVADPGTAAGHSRSTSTSSTTGSIVTATDGAAAHDCRSTPRSVADFYAEVDGHASTSSGWRRASGRCRSRSPTRSRSTTTTSTPPTTPSRSQRFWLALVEMDRVSSSSSGRVRRQGQPGAPVLGRARPRRHPVLGPAGATASGGAPNCGPHVMHEAYSHEVSSAGYWPGPTARGSSTPTPTPSRRATETTQSRPASAAGTTRSASSCCPTERPHRARPGCRAARVPPLDLRRRRRDCPLEQRRARTMSTTGCAVHSPGDVADVEPSSTGCEDCLRIGGAGCTCACACTAATSAAATTRPTVTPPPTGTRTATTRSSARTNPARTGGGATPTSSSSRSTAHHRRRATHDARTVATDGFGRIADRFAQHQSEPWIEWASTQSRG